MAKVIVNEKSAETSDNFQLVKLEKDKSTRDMIQFGCRSGSCGVCICQVEEGQENLEPMKKNEKEYLEAMGMPGTGEIRLACQTVVKSGTVKISIEE